MVLPLRSAGFWILKSSPDHELHETFAAEHGDDFDGYAILPHDDRAISQDAAERRVAGADFFGDIDAAATDRIVHVQAPLAKSSLCLWRAGSGRRPAESEAPEINM